MQRKILLLSMALALLPGLAAAAEPQEIVVARGRRLAITAQEFRDRVAGQSPFERSRLDTLERKKALLQDMIRYEVLVREAERQGLQNDPEIWRALHRIMVQRLVQLRFPGRTATDVPEPEIARYYAEHSADYHRPRQVRAVLVVLPLPPDAGGRARALAAARKARARLAAAEPASLATVASALSGADGTGDTGLRSAAELAAAHGEELAVAVLALRTGETSAVVRSARALFVARATAVQAEVTRTLEQVRPLIVIRLAREQQSREFEQWMAELLSQAEVTIDDEVLDAIDLASPDGEQRDPHP